MTTLRGLSELLYELSEDLKPVDSIGGELLVKTDCMVIGYGNNALFFGGFEILKSYTRLNGRVPAMLQHGSSHMRKSRELTVFRPG